MVLPGVEGWVEVRGVERASRSWNAAVSSDADSEALSIKRNQSLRRAVDDVDTALQSELSPSCVLALLERTVLVLGPTAFRFEPTSADMVGRCGRLDLTIPVATDAQSVKQTALQEAKSRAWQADNNTCNNELRCPTDRNLLLFLHTLVFCRPRPCTADR